MLLFLCYHYYYSYDYYYYYLCLQIAEKYIFFFFSFVYDTEVVLWLILLAIERRRDGLNLATKWTPNASAGNNLAPQNGFLSPALTDSSALMSRAVRTPLMLSRIKDRTWTFDEDCSFAEDYFTTVSQCYRVWVDFMAAGS